MKDPKQLEIARAHFARAESRYASPVALEDVEKALAALEEIRDRDDEITALSERIAFTYATRLCDHLQRLLRTDAHIPEPQLEHFFKLLRAFDDSIIELPAVARQLKIEFAKRLIDHYLEGHSAEEKAKALRQLLDIAASN
jgi:CRP-like cAMP-binding protein